VSTVTRLLDYLFAWLDRQPDGAMLAIIILVLLVAVVWSERERPRGTRSHRNSGGRW